MKVAVIIDTPALGDTIAAIPTLRKISQAYGGQKLTVLTSKPFLFDNHPLVEDSYSLETELSDAYTVYRTFSPLAGKAHKLIDETIEFRHSNMDIRQFHAVSLGFTLLDSEMETDLYVEKVKELPYKDYVIIHPTHTWPTRTWEQGKWQQLIDKLNQKGIPVIAIGQDSKEVGTFSVDKPVMDINIRLGANLLNDSETDIPMIRWMMNNRARAVVTMDSGILHVAGTTDVNIVQLSSSVNYKLRAPYRKGVQDYKYTYVDGGCEMCSSDMQSNVNVHGSIHAIPPQIYCLKNKSFDECHPSVDQVLKQVTKLYTQEEIKTIMKKKIVFLTPHLSTGGMPQFVLTRLEALQDQDEFETHLIEYTQYATAYIVQREKIQNVLGNNFHSLGYLDEIDVDERTKRLTDKLTEINPDIIHIDECPEAFDSFNKLSPTALEFIYSENSKWKVVETCHNIWFQGKDKQYHPDSYILCTPHHLHENFKENTNSSRFVSTYPIIDLTPTEKEKEEARNVLGLDNTKINILNVGLWTEGKNQGEGVEIAHKLHKKHPGKFHFHFVGNQASNFKDYWGEINNNLPPNVSIYGERNDVTLFMQASDAFMFNSTHECNPLVLREALSYKLPTFSRILKQYGDMFSEYVNELTEDCDTNSNIIADSLLKLNTSLSTYKEYNLKTIKNNFKEEHLTAYTEILQQDKVHRITKKVIGKTRLEYKSGLKLHLDKLSEGSWRAEFWDNQDLVHTADNLKEGHWYGPNREWHTEWEVKVFCDNVLINTHRWNLNGKEVLVVFDSSSLGDTIAWMGQMENFKKEYSLKKLYVKTFKNWLFDKQWYKDQGILLVDKVHGKTEIVYNVGVYYTNDTPWDRNKHKYDWRGVPLAKIATDRLGIVYKENKPLLSPIYTTVATGGKKKSIVIATQSTAQAKYWNNPTGWQDLVDHYNNTGYKVLHSSKEGTDLKDIEQLPEDLADIATAINNSEMLIGISSGLSWFAWALEAKVVIISGFTDPYVEFKDAIHVNNHQVCHGCWGNHTFDKGDWNWCPVWKDTHRQFECTKTITATDVISKIKKS